MSIIYIFIILCALAALAYGAFTSRAVLSASTGNDRMRQISAAVQEGAAAYLNRQYTTIGIVGIVVAIILFILFDWTVALGYLDRRLLSGAAGYVGMNISVRANVRVADGARQGLARGLDIAFKAGAVTGMLVAGLALLAVAVYYFILLGLGATGRDLIDPAGGSRLRRLADLDLRPSRRRHLHQGRRRRRRSGRQGRGRHSRGRPTQPGRYRRQRRRQRRRLRRHGGRPVRDLRRDGGRDDGAGLDLLRRARR